MRKICNCTLVGALFALLGLASCSDEAPWADSSTTGGINLNFSSDPRVMRQTRADDSVSPVVPSGDFFAVNLVKADGSFSRSWSSVEAFNREDAFPIGDYTLTATYGDIDTEGFQNPYYKGSTDVHVSPGALAEAQVVATLANAMVSIRYTPAFVENFPSHSAAVQSEGHDWVVFSQNEERPAYVAPSEIKINLTLTNTEGKQVTIQPASFTAQARHHYVVTIGVDGTSGNLALDVQFDDDVVNETVSVSLGDELFNAPAPTLSPKGFEADGTVESFEYSTQSTPTEFHIFAYGGLKSTTVNVVANNGFSPSFGSRVELVNASDLTQQQLANDGMVCSGFFRNADKLGVVNITKFFEHLPAGSYTVEVQAVDAMTRTSEPLKLNINVTEVLISFAEAPAIDFMANEVAVIVNTNTLTIKDNISFKVPDANNRMIDATIKSITDVTNTPSDGAYALKYVLDLQPQTGSAIDVVGSLGTKTISTSVAVNAPEYTITPDAFSRKVVLLLSAGDDATTKNVFENVRFYNGESEIPSANISHDASTGLVTISGLSPTATYSSIVAKVGAFEKAVPEFTTETETDVTNGNFAAATETINLPNVQVGGKYRVGAFDYYNRSNIVRSTPDSWANLNSFTCYTGAANINTWFVVPSTYSENGCVVIRSVGYHHNGTTPAKTGSFWSTNYYCQNAPSELNKSRGELFLGSYSFSGSASRTDGIAWNSRPSTLSFDYTYAPLNNEKGEAYIKVLAADGSVLAEQTILLSSVSTMTSRTLTLSNYPFGKKAAKIQIGFKSTQSGVDPSIYIPSGDELYESGVRLDTNYYWDLDPNTYHAVAIGSVLTIDNVKLGYAASSAASAAPKVTAKKSTSHKTVASRPGAKARVNRK
ncbi:MAG: DUF4493 domain-containing protein [Lepagella sp.]